MRIYPTNTVAVVHNLTNVLVIDNPSEDPQIRGDPFRTLFVSRLSYDVKEADLEREFGRFGPIERVCTITIHLSTLCALANFFVFVRFES